MKENGPELIGARGLRVRGEVIPATDSGCAADSLPEPVPDPDGLVLRDTVRYPCRLRAHSPKTIVEMAD